MVSRRPGQLSRGAFLAGSLAVISGCKTAGFKEVFMSLDQAGKRKTKIFPTQFTSEDQGIFCQVRYSSGRDDAELKVFVTAPSEDTPALLVGGDSILLTRGEGQLSLQVGILVKDEGGKAKVNPLGPYEEGDYRIDFFIDNEKEDSVPFFVREPEVPEAPEG
jgi:hypothetical protein